VLRIIAGIIVGWIVMAILVMVVFLIAWLALGDEGTFQPDTYWTTNTFNIAVLGGGTVAAIVGGLVCALITRKAIAPFVLAAIVLALGLASAAMEMNKPDPPARTDDVTMQSIATHGKEPMWFAFTSPALAAVGIVIGSRLVSAKGRSTAA
jgi:peptidoglycan/LPS O-acetylase OafA/YrhL